jgi:putative DNA primase/helicase
LASGEPVTAKHLYKNIHQIHDYAKFIFNCNALPKDVENSPAFFRRFLIIPFKVTIPEAEQDKRLASKIIESELSGVFNWVLIGLKRLLEQESFSESQAALEMLSRYQLESDSVRMFLDEYSYAKHACVCQPIKELFLEYNVFCSRDGIIPASKNEFINRLEIIGIRVQKKNIGKVAYLVKALRSDGDE